MSDDACCPIARHPLQGQIDDYLRGNWRSTKINDVLIAKGVPIITADIYSRHRRHLGLEKKAMGRPPGQVLLPEDPADAPPADFQVPDLSEVKDEALRVFFWRLKTRPQKVNNQQLVPILAKALEHDAKRPARSPIEDILAQLADSVPVDVMGRVDGRRDDGARQPSEIGTEAGSDADLSTAVGLAAGAELDERGGADADRGGSAGS